MKIEFLGTRANTELTSKEHRRHSALLVHYRHGAVMIDCGADWREEVWSINPRAIVLTHAHPDHAWGLKDGAPCPVYATAVTQTLIAAFPIEDLVEIGSRAPFEINGIEFEAFSVDHSTRAPAVGYRITTGRASLFYVPDVVNIHDRSAALAGIHVYIGDGATLTRSMLRRQAETIVGHAPVRTQLAWCQGANVRRAIFTHCGSEIIRKGFDQASAELEALATRWGVNAAIARDALEVAIC